MCVLLSLLLRTGIGISDHNPTPPPVSRGQYECVYYHDPRPSRLISQLILIVTP